MILECERCGEPYDVLPDNCKVCGHLLNPDAFENISALPEELESAGLRRDLDVRKTSEEEGKAEKASSEIPKSFSPISKGAGVPPTSNAVWFVDVSPEYVDEQAKHELLTELQQTDQVHVYDIETARRGAKTQANVLEASGCIFLFLFPPIGVLLLIIGVVLEVLIWAKIIPKDHNIKQEQLVDFDSPQYSKRLAGLRFKYSSHKIGNCPICKSKISGAFREGTKTICPECHILLGAKDNWVYPAD